MNDIETEYQQIISLMCAVIANAFKDARRKKTSTHDHQLYKQDAISFLTDKYPSAWGLYASEMAIFIGIPILQWKRAISELKTYLADKGEANA